MSHHGMNLQHGINAMCKNDLEHQGRFGRIFSNLNSNYNLPNELVSLGKKGGPMDGGTSRNPLSTIPMGMVFFGQFIDHDITLDTTSALDRVNDPNATENFRTPALDLDNIYGSGPEANAFLYKNGLYILTGKDGTGLTNQNSNHRNNDLVRNSEGTAIIGDPRNDENRVISQIQLAMINFHNKVVDHYISEDNISSNDLRNPSIRKELFEKAKESVTWHYQWIVINEFLPLIVGKPILKNILGEGRKFYKPNRAFIPIEFSVAAYRFGHSLVPQKLKVKTGQTHDFELFGATLGFGFSPISDDKQIIDWEVLFDIDQNTQSQRTDKLDTKMPSDLLELPFIRSGEKSLATRNLLRGQSFLLPSGENVAKHINADQTEIITIINHINSQIGNINLSNGIPLWYYILAEAECIGRNDEDGNKPGEGLGTVGATIVAETLIGLIELDSMSFLNKNRSWSPTLGTTQGEFTMKDLLNF